MLVAADPYRLAAILQLQQLGECWRPCVFPGV